MVWIVFLQLTLDDLLNYLLDLREWIRRKVGSNRMIVEVHTTVRSVTDSSLYFKYQKVGSYTYEADGVVMR